MRSMIDYAYYFQHCFFLLEYCVKIVLPTASERNWKKKREREKETVEFDVVFFGIISK